MVKEITEQERFLLPDSTMELFISNIVKEITDFKNSGKLSSRFIIGGFIAENIELKDGTKVNAWIDYDAKVLELGLIDAGIKCCVLFDGDVPDEVLDRMNYLKKRRC